MGRANNTAYVIQSGGYDVWKTRQGERQLARRLGPGDVFGETAVFAPGPRTASIVAWRWPTTLKVVTGDSLNLTDSELRDESCRLPPANPIIRSVMQRI